MVVKRPTEAQRVDQIFRVTVDAIDRGDTSTVAHLLAEEPALACLRLTSPGQWLRDIVGEALDGFFKEPYLLWFVAEDPIRRGTLPRNIPEIAQVIAEKAKQSCPEFQQQLNYALSLVAWSSVAHRSEVQLPLIDVLLDAGAASNGAPENALINGHTAAAEHLLRRGAPATLASTAVLGQWAEFRSLLPAATARDKQFALTLAALRGRSHAIRELIGIGADPDCVSEELYSHAYPLHHAVSSGSLEAVKVLVEHGATLDLADSVHEATPLGWSEYLQESQPECRRIAEYLRTVSKQ
jgi:peptide-methionine (S)-S-oxide reductase